MLRHSAHVHARSRSGGQGARYGAALGVALFAAILAGAVVVPAGPVQATPAFSEKTKLDCNACHTRGYPLTPLGDKFKANNYKLPAAKRPCKKVTIKLFDPQGVFQRTYSGCFPTDGAKITIGQ